MLKLKFLFLLGSRSSKSPDADVISLMLVTKSGLISFPRISTIMIPMRMLGSGPGFETMTLYLCSNGAGLQH